MLGGQLHELVHQGGQLAGFAVEVVEDSLAGVRREVVEAAEHGDVGPQAGERRPQLVARVLHEPLLILARARQCAEHAAERHAEPAGLVLAADGHRHVEPPGQCDLLGGRSEADEPARRLAGDEPADDCRDRGHESDREQRSVALRGEDAVVLRQAAGGLDRASAFTDRHGEGSVVLAVDVRVVPSLDQGLRARGDGDVDLVDRQLTRCRIQPWVPGLVDRLHQDLLEPRQAAVHETPVGAVVRRSHAVPEAWRRVVPQLRHHRCHRGRERSVDLVVEPVGGAPVGRDADRNRRQRAQGDECNDELQAQAHGARTV